MKLATWNLQHPVTERRRNDIRLHTDQVAADVWVLTETHDGFSIGLKNAHSSAPGRDGNHEPGHRWATIWSNYRLEPIETADSMRTAAAHNTRQHAAERSAGRRSGVASIRPSEQLKLLFQDACIRRRVVIQVSTRIPCPIENPFLSS